MKLQSSASIGIQNSGNISSVLALNSWGLHMELWLWEWAWDPGPFPELGHGEGRVC